MVGTRYSSGVENKDKQTQRKIKKLTLICLTSYFNCENFDFNTFWNGVGELKETVDLFDE
jgi:hypothetical protein